MTQPIQSNGPTMQQLLQNFAFTQNRPTWIINPLPIENIVPPGQTDINYAQFGGNVPGVAQYAQANPSPPPAPTGYFSKTAQQLSEWFSTRVHLSPTGNADNGS